MSDPERPHEPGGNRPLLHVAFAAPAWWPATAFGGPIPVGRAIAGGLAARGHRIEVLTTAILDLHHERTWRERGLQDGDVRIRRLATPLRYRWMGITPGLPLALARLGRPDVVHVYGFRDPLTTVVAGWCAASGIPYVFEGLGMVEPRFRKVRAKRLLDATAFRHVPRRAAAVVAVSDREREMYARAGVDPQRIHVRGNPFPAGLATRGGALRGRLGLDGERLVLYVGRIGAGKGVEVLLAAMRELPGVHLALVGPDEGHETGRLARAAAAHDERIHVLPPVDDPLPLYADADVVVLPSEGDSFGMAAAEAVACGVPVVVSDQAGVAEFLDGAALVVPLGRPALREAIARVLDDEALASRLAEAGPRVAAANDAEATVERQLSIYRTVLAAG